MSQLASSHRSAPSEPSVHPLGARVVTDACQLETLVPAWHRLVERGAWRNPCYEPEFLIPLVKQKTNDNARVLIIEAPNAGGESGDLLGLVPLVDRPFYHLPFRCAHAWRPDESFDATPLLDTRHAESAFQTMLTALGNEGVRLLAFDTVSASADFEALISNACSANRISVFRRDCYSRAALRPAGDADAYLTNELSKSRRKKAQRLLQNLGQCGEVRFEQSNDSSDANQWAQAFIDLEASGWKGRAGTAIANRADSLAFFLEMVDRFATRDAIRFGKLTLDGTPIAILANIGSGNHVSAYKTAFDERFADYSPGFLLEMQNIRWLHQSECTLCDSCTDPNNELINRLYTDRLPFQNIVLGLDTRIHRWVNTVLPSMQKAAQFAKRLQQTPARIRKTRKLGTGK